MVESQAFFIISYLSLFFFSMIRVNIHVSWTVNFHFFFLLRSVYLLEVLADAVKASDMVYVRLSLTGFEFLLSWCETEK